jgi:hypothetical protein
VTTTWLDKVPVDTITTQAREVHPGRTALTLVAAALFGLGWVTARVFAVLWLAATWSTVAVREGWRASHGPSRKTRIEALEAERKELRTRLARLGG